MSHQFAGSFVCATAYACYQFLARSLLTIVTSTLMQHHNNVWFDENIWKNMCIHGWRTAKLSDIVPL